MTRLFNPRTDHWEEHFQLDKLGGLIGLTSIDRTTVYVLGMNADIRIQIRLEIAKLEAEED